MSIEQDRRDAVILANVRRIIKKTRQHNWILAMETFGFGSTRAWEMCARLGLDPESRTTSMSTMFDHIERNQVAANDHKVAA
ncbi:MAG: hypothetical protein JWP44_4373 [Mucilaginibacter sp.]|nr:hypothetical protein [Mucilaginibacter sp.]